MKHLYAILALSAFAATPAAHADAKLSDCLKLQKQVFTALESAPAGNTIEEARSEANAARSFCAAHLYTQGVAHYSKALGLLGKSSETAVRL